MISQINELKRLDGNPLQAIHIAAQQIFLVTTAYRTKETIECIEIVREFALQFQSDGESDLAVAHATVRRVLHSYWNTAISTTSDDLALPVPPSGIGTEDHDTKNESLIGILSDSLAKLSLIDACYTIGLLYTVLMPKVLRADLGAFYTPPSLIDILLDKATEAGVDWSSAKVLDPACGAGGFLLAAAYRMSSSQPKLDSQEIAQSILKRLTGVEIDPFAAWLAQVFMSLFVLKHCGARPRPELLQISICDCLNQSTWNSRFDLVVGNPPYGRVKLSSHLRRKYARSLFGHANRYGLFMDQALRLLEDEGTLAFITPSSILAGKYFKALRKCLVQEAPPRSIGFVRNRLGVFVDVLQETILAVYKKDKHQSSQSVFSVSDRKNSALETTPVGIFNLPPNPEQAWLVPRNARQNQLIQVAGTSEGRLIDLGFTVATGPLVWNRHKESLHDEHHCGSFPVIWAESVRPTGTFDFRTTKSNRKHYFKPKRGEEWVVTSFSCVLVQRTTAMEQKRRLVAAELPMSFINEHCAVVVENHLNMIRSVNSRPSIKLATLAAVLNSDVVDQLFRCISGSVAVSAYELASLPMPSSDAMKAIETEIESGISMNQIESLILQAYVRSAS